MIGLAFLTSAAWIYLSDIRSTLFAALVIGGVYTGLGLIMFALASRDRPVPMAHPTNSEPPAAATPAGIIAALMQGLGAGMAAGAAKRAARSESEKPAAPAEDSPRDNSI